MQLVQEDSWGFVFRRSDRGSAVLILGLIVSLFCLLFGLGGLIVGLYNVQLALVILLALSALAFFRSALYKEADAELDEVLIRRSDNRVYCRNAANTAPTVILNAYDIRAVRIRRSDLRANNAADNAHFFDLMLVLHEGATLTLWHNVYGRDRAERIRREIDACLLSDHNRSACNAAEFVSTDVIPVIAESSQSCFRVLSPSTGGFSTGTLGLITMWPLLGLITVLSAEDYRVQYAMIVLFVVSLIALFAELRKRRQHDATATEIRFGEEMISVTVLNDSKHDKQYEVVKVATIGFAPYEVDKSSELYILDVEALNSAMALDELMEEGSERSTALRRMEAGFDEVSKLLRSQTLPSLGRSTLWNLVSRQLYRAAFEAQRDGQEFSQRSTRFLKVLSDDVLRSGDSLLKTLLWSSRGVAFLAVLSLLIPLLSFILAMLSYKASQGVRDPGMYIVASVLHLSAIFVVVAKLLADGGLRVLGLCLGLSAVLYLLSICGVDPLQLGIGFHLMVMSVLILLSSWKLMRRPELR